MPKRQSGNKKNKQSNFAKLSIFQPNKYKFKKNCPLSIKGAPKIDYKNIKLLKRYVSENGKILPSRITTPLTPFCTASTQFSILGIIPP